MQLMGIKHPETSKAGRMRGKPRPEELNKLLKSWTPRKEQGSAGRAKGEDTNAMANQPGPSTRLNLKRSGGTDSDVKM